MHHILDEKLDNLRRDIAHLHVHFDERFDALPCKTSCPGAERRKSRAAYIAAIAIPLATAIVGYVAARVSHAEVSAPSVAHSRR
jgi:hypothetical protein